MERGNENKATFSQDGTFLIRAVISLAGLNIFLTRAHSFTRFRLINSFLKSVKQRCIIFIEKLSIFITILRRHSLFCLPERIIWHTRRDVFYVCSSSSSSNLFVINRKITGKGGTVIHIMSHDH